MRSVRHPKKDKGYSVHKACYQSAFLSALPDDPFPNAVMAVVDLLMFIRAAGEESPLSPVDIQNGETAFTGTVADEELDDCDQIRNAIAYGACRGSLF